MVKTEEKGIGEKAGAALFFMENCDKKGARSQEPEVRILNSK
jgi:hypothetical protein